jgi:beta-lactamase superfamily II metal-dependent hydrolase
LTDIVFRLHALPAGNGDALIVEYGTSDQTRLVLVDGGVAKAAQAVGGFLGGDAALELLVVTHIDNDQIAGVLKLLNQPHPPRPNEVWFNGYRHLPGSAVEAMGPVEGEKFTTLITDRGYRWNRAFEGGAVALTGVSPPSDELTGGLRWAVLSPGMPQLRALRQRSTWTQVVRDAGLDPRVAPPPPPEPLASGLERMGPPNIRALADQATVDDTAPANGSTIVMLFEYAGRCCLLAGDAHPGVLISGIDRLVGPGGVLEVDVFKLPHHGSKANVTKQLLSRVRAHTYVFCTDGSGNQRHPDDQAVARVIRYGADAPELVFNYRSVRNEIWDNAALKRANNYRTSYPVENTTGITVDLMAPES